LEEFFSDYAEDLQNVGQIAELDLWIKGGVAGEPHRMRKNPNFSEKDNKKIEIERDRLAPTASGGGG